ncbi:hypothetical protein MDAP_000927 [Mitosporidium daphniae]
MFGFRKGNAILSSLPVASKKRKPAEEIKPAPAKRQSPNQGGCDDPDTAKPIAMHPMKEEIFCTPFSTRICAANYEEYSTPANKSATLDLFCKDQEASAHTDEVDDFRCKTDASLDLLIANSPNLDLIELASSAPVAHSGDKLLETLKVRLRFWLTRLETIAQLYDSLDLLVQKISDQMSTLQDAYVSELSHKVAMTGALKSKAGNI